MRFLFGGRVLSVALLAAVLAALTAGTAAAKPQGFNGKIVTNSDNLVTGEEQVYTVDPDGTDEELVYNNSEVGQWSPDGTRIALVTQLGPPQVLLFNVDDGSSVYFGLPFDRYPGLALFCTVWSPDGARLACEGQGETDPGLTGVYTLRSSDGGDLQRVTSDPTGDDCPSDYSPNGKRLVITRANDTTYEIDTVKLDGSGMKRITPDGMDFNFCNGSWSPQSNEIIFSAHVPNGPNGLRISHSSIWVVHFDGTGLRQLPIAGPCGGLLSDPTTYGCFNPVWSPDGRKIVFGRNIADEQRDLYTVNADGSGLFQVTNTPDISEFNGDWGIHPLTP
jgi:Tol biopolymer transport system component